LVSLISEGGEGRGGEETEGEGRREGRKESEWCQGKSGE
jgi:hypothetical protein